MYEEIRQEAETIYNQVVDLAEQLEELAIRQRKMAEGMGSSYSGILNDWQEADTAAVMQGIALSVLRAAERLFDVI